MRSAKKALPVLFVLSFVFGLSYYLFTVYKPEGVSEVKGISSDGQKKSYLDSIPFPTGSEEIGRNERDGFSQITMSNLKKAEEVQKFYRGVLVSKGWTSKDDSADLLSIIYTRDNEKIEVSVLSADEKKGTVFSISYTE